MNESADKPSTDKPSAADPAQNASTSPSDPRPEAATAASASEPASPEEEKLDLSADEKLWGMLCHLLALTPLIGIVPGMILGPLIVWLVKKNEMPFVDDQGKESLNFQITALIAFAVCAAMFMCWIGLFVFPIVAVAWLIFVIIAAVKANDGIKYRYPWTIRFIK